MKDFVITMCVLEGLRTAIRLLSVGTQVPQVFSSGGLALNIFLSIAILLWGTYLLSKK